MPRRTSAFRPLALILAALAAQVFGGSARGAVLGPSFGLADPTGFGPGAHYGFLVGYFGAGEPLGRLTAGDTLTFFDVPGGSGSAVGAPFAVSTAPTADDPGHADVIFTYDGPTLGAINTTFHGDSQYGFTLDAATLIGPTVRLRSRVGLLPSQGDQYAYNGFAYLPYPVPEPASWGLMVVAGVGLAGAGWIGRRRRRAA